MLSRFSCFSRKLSFIDLLHPLHRLLPPVSRRRLLTTAPSPFPRPRRKKVLSKNSNLSLVSTDRRTFSNFSCVHGRFSPTPLPSFPPSRLRPLFPATNPSSVRALLSFKHRPI